MKKKYLNIVLTILLLSGFMIGCFNNTEHKLDEAKQGLVYVKPLEYIESPVVNINEDEEMTISVPIEEHQLSITRENGEENLITLSVANVRELESWWDSLPQPVQFKIKTKEIDIELVSSIRTHNENDINPFLNDSQVESTGETLEQIIGQETDMKYTVNTVLIDNGKEVNQGEHATNIRLVKHIPVKLNKFNADIFIRDQDVSNENIRTLQYWWMSLPEDIRNKIKKQELMLDLTCHTIIGLDDKSSDNSLTDGAEDYVAIMGDILNRMVGVYKIGDKTISIAKMNTYTKIDTSNSVNLNFPANQYLNISIRRNKISVPSPL
jgi:hypothetical protein